MKILIIEPHKHPRRAEITHTLEDMQKTVGGYIEVTYPFDEDPVGLVCDEEGLYKDTEWNRYICPGMAIKGTFFLCGLGEEDLSDLPDELMEKYEKLLWEPHIFVRTLKGPMVITGNGKTVPIS